eukprot:GILK01010468.1.p1 GENE.GILK01010468.1~~GILK01010468.1.p1  ORF type:complete len:699 (-),score=140.42 GILK01010468.1:90-2186(-)
MSLLSAEYKRSRDSLIARLLEERQKRFEEKLDQQRPKSPDTELPNHGPIRTDTHTFAHAVDSPPSSPQRAWDTPMPPFAAAKSHNQSQSKAEEQNNSLFVGTPRTRPSSAPPRNRAESVTRRSKDSTTRQPETPRQGAFSFRPQIKELPQGGPFNYSNKDANLTREQRLARLAQSKTRDFTHRDMERRRKEKEELESCTFRPQLNPKSAAVMAAKRAKKTLPDRLHHEADQRALLREKAKRQLEEEEMAQYSFRPKVKIPAGLAHVVEERRPIFERVGEVQKEKMEHLQQLRRETEQSNPNLTFKPMVSEQSARIIEARRQYHDTQNLPVTERLTREHEETVSKKLRRQEELQAELSQDYTFKPQISSSTAVLVHTSALFQGNNRDFLERQNTFAEMQRDKQTRLIDQLNDERDQTFAPHVNRTSQILAASKTARAGETYLEKIERLHHKDKQRVEMIRHSMAQQYYGQFQFKPDINPISKKLARAMSFEELSANERHKNKQQEIREAAEAAFAEEHTFRPDIYSNTTKYRDVQPHYKLDDNVMTQIKAEQEEKKRKVSQTKRDLEYEEMRGCTFTPEIIRGSAVTSQQSAVLVRGLGRYLELKELSKRLEEEKREREEKAFKIKVPTSGQVYTIPEPFAFTQDPSVEDRRAKLKQEAIERVMKDCTFNPQTMESKNKSLIQEMLREADAKAKAALVY